MRSLMVIGAMLATAAATGNYFRMPTPYSYSCQEGNCIREKRLHAENYMSLGECTLSCGEYGSLWPKPTGRVELSTDLISFHPENVRFTKIGVTTKRLENMLDNASHYFLRKLHFKHPEYPQSGKGPFNEFEYQQDRDDKFDSQRKNYGIMRYEKISPFTKKKSDPSSQKYTVNIEITVTSDDHALRLDTDESYDIVSKTVRDTTTVTIIASTYYGARHALESLSQLMAYDELNNSLMMFESTRIHDEPAYKYRSIMLDTGRNFYPKEEIMRLLDTMSSNKLNTFHWHIADSASFPMYSQSQPEMAYVGAYSPSKVYYPEDIREIVNYANLRGIRVVPELSAPAHTGAGWTFGEDYGKGKLTLCTDEGPWFEYCNEPPCGQLNPVNPEVYNVLKGLYSDIVDAFDPELIHMGGDDVSFECWVHSPEIIAYLAENEKDASTEEIFKLWNTFQEKAYSKLTEASEKRGSTVMPIIYSSPFERKYIDHNSYIVQVTKEANETVIEDYLGNNHKVIFNNVDAWDFGVPASPSWRTGIGRPEPRHPWKEAYESSPLDILSRFGATNSRSSIKINNANIIPSDLILGGEATIRSYAIDQASLQATIWPTASAMAERLWSDPISKYHGAEEAQNRLAAHRERMVSEGTQAEVFQPEYCFRNQDSCYSQNEYEFRTEIRPTKK